MKEVDPIRNSVLDNHPLGVALDQLDRRAMELVGDQKGWLLMPQIIYDDLTKLSLIVTQVYPAVQNPWGLVDPRNALKLNSPPGRHGLLVDLLGSVGGCSR